MTRHQKRKIDEIHVEVCLVTIVASIMIYIFDVHTSSFVEEHGLSKSVQ